MRITVHDINFTGSQNTFKVLKRWKNKRTGKILIGIYNSLREQYEIYPLLKKHECYYVPYGTDDFDLEVAFCEALNYLSWRKKHR